MKILKVSVCTLALSVGISTRVCASDGDKDMRIESLDLMEFVGDWTATDGKWQDPVELLPMDELDDAASKDETK